MVQKPYIFQSQKLFKKQFLKKKKKKNAPLSSFKINIKKWKPGCPCGLCKYFFFFSLRSSHFQPMFDISLGLSLSLMHTQKPFSFSCGSNQVVGFSISCRIARDIEFWWNVGSNQVNVFVRQLYLNIISVKKLQNREVLGVSSSQNIIINILTINTTIINIQNKFHNSFFTTSAGL